MPIVSCSMRPESNAAIAAPAGHAGNAIVRRALLPTAPHTAGLRWPQERITGAARGQTSTYGARSRRRCSLLPVVVTAAALEEAGWIGRRPHRHGGRGRRQRIGGIRRVQAEGVPQSDTTEKSGKRVSPKHRCVNIMATSAIVLTKTSCRTTTCSYSRYTRAGAAAIIRDDHRHQIRRADCTHCMSVCSSPVLHRQLVRDQEPLPHRQSTTRSREPRGHPICGSLGSNSRNFPALRPHLDAPKPSSDQPPVGRH